MKIHEKKSCFCKILDNEKKACYNPVHKQLKEVMNWGTNTIYAAGASGDGSGDGF